MKLVFKHFNVTYSVFHHLSPSANFFSPPLVPLFLRALVSLSRNYSSSEEATYIERGQRYEISLNSTLSPHNKDSPVFSSIEPGSVTSSYCRSDHLFQSSIDYRQFPFDYDVLTGDFDCYERRKKVSQLHQIAVFNQKKKIELPAVLCKMAPSIKLAARRVRDGDGSRWGGRDEPKSLVDRQQGTGSPSSLRGLELC